MALKSIYEYEQDLKNAKKSYDKLCKQYKKCKSSYQAEMLAEDIEDLRQDIIELQILINEIRQGKRLKDCNVDQFVY
jgi:prefoldin subunit 5